MTDYTIEWIDRLPVTEDFGFLGVISSKVGPIDENLYPSCDWGWISEQKTANTYLYRLIGELREHEGFTMDDVYTLMKESSIYGFVKGSIYYLGACDDFEAVCSMLIDGENDD